MEDEIYVQIIDLVTDEVEKTFGPMNMRKAVKLSRGIEVNLGHDFDVVITENPK